MKAGIIGGAGYTAGELIRLLLNHPEADLAWVASESNAGNLLSSVHTGLLGDTEMRFVAEPRLDEADVAFLCQGHGRSSEFWRENPMPEHLRVVDLAQDFRDEQGGYVYGLPELNRDRIKGARLVANPGCFATAIQLSLLPAVEAHAIDGDSVGVTAVTGSTGAGVKPGATTHFSWRSDNLSVYKVFTHQHLDEIGRNLTIAGGGKAPRVRMVPVRGDFARGIFAMTTFSTKLTAEELRQIYTERYAGEPFTKVAPGAICLKDAVGTNKAVVGIEQHGSDVLVTVAIDNLLKGASGQAVECMNLMYGIDERAGLALKASAF